MWQKDRWGERLVTRTILTYSTCKLKYLEFFIQIIIRNPVSCIGAFYAPLEKGGILFCNCRSVGRYVGLSVCRPSRVWSISFDPFTWSIPNLVQGLPSMSRWSLLIFRSHDQRSRSNHSSKPNVLSAQYLLTPSFDQYHTWCRGCLNE